MNRSRRALLGALVALTALGAACRRHRLRAGGGGEPPPPPKPVFPEIGCYHHVGGSDFQVTKPIDTSNNGEVRLSTDGSCDKPLPAGPKAGVTLVRADAKDVLATCTGIEPGTSSVTPSRTEIVEGTPDVWLCRGGIAAGDCVRGVRYDGPIDSLDNAVAFKAPDCSDAELGPETVVVAADLTAAIVKCFSLVGAKPTPTQLLQLVWRC